MTILRRLKQIQDTGKFASETLENDVKKDEPTRRSQRKALKKDFNDKKRRMISLKIHNDDLPEIDEIARFSRVLSKKQYEGLAKHTCGIYFNHERHVIVGCDFYSSINEIKVLWSILEDLAYHSK